MDFVPSPSQTIGPYFHIFFNAKGTTPSIADRQAKGEHIHLVCRVIDGEGAMMPDAFVELWQADAAGIYNHPSDERSSEADPAVKGFGRLPTDGNGVCVFQTVKPGRTPGPEGYLQAPHINVSVFGRGVLKQLMTRIYFAGEAANDEDPILKLIPSDRRETLMAHADPDRPGWWTFDVRLHGEAETVFFDL